MVIPLLNLLMCIFFAIVKGGLSLSSFIGREREEWIVTFGKQDFNLK